MRHLSFAQLYKSHSEALTSFAFTLTNNRMDAEDLVQETALKAFANFHRYDDDFSFKNWSFTILKNTFMTKYRKRKKMKIVSTPIEDMLFAFSTNISVSENKNANNCLTHIYKCINSLSPKSREPFQMYINGYRYDEIAMHLQIPIGTVKSRINYARNKLKKTLCKNELAKAG